MERFRKSYETQKIEAFLRDLPIGETATYARLSELINSTVDGATSALLSARDILEREGGYVFATVTKTGVKRLSDADIVQDTEDARRRLARRAKVAMRRLGNIKDFSSLTDDQKRRHQAHAVIYAAIAEKASSANAAQLTRTVSIDGQAMLAAIKSAARTGE